MAVYQEKFYADSKNVVIILVVCAAIYRSEYQLGLGGAALCSAAEASRDNRLAGHRDRERCDEILCE